MRRRKPRPVGLLPALLLAYLLLFPRGSGEELQIRTLWVTEIDAAAPTEADDNPIAFRLGDRFGFLGADGRVLFSDRVLYDVAISDTRYANFSEVSQTVVVHDAWGRFVGTLDSEGYPLFVRDQMLLLHPDGATVSRWRPDGTRIWRRSFSSVYTAIDAGNGVTLVGSADGRLVALDDEGREILHYRSSTGRLPVITGVAVAADGTRLAAVADIDPQRVVLFSRNGEGYSPAAEYRLATSLRRPVRIRFLAGTGLLVWEQHGSLGGLVIDSGLRFDIALPGTPIDFAAVTEFDLIAVTVDDPGELLLFRPPHQAPLLRLALETSTTFLRVEGSTIYLGVDDRIVAYRLERG